MYRCLCIIYNIFYCYSAYYVGKLGYIGVTSPELLLAPSIVSLRGHPRVGQFVESSQSCANPMPVDVTDVTSDQIWG